MELTSEDVAHEFFPFLRIYKNGRIERIIMTSRVPPGLDSTTGVQSKDVIISRDTKLSGRIFIPKLETPQKLPLLIHYHGGAFCTGTAFCPIVKYTLNKFVSSSKVVTLSVDYRLAPEHPLPIAFEDSWDAIKWVETHVHGHGDEDWLNEYVDFQRVFITGDGAGANIAHYVVLEAGLVKLDPQFRIIGLSLVHPYFGTDEPDPLYKYLCPSTSGVNDDPMLNPSVDPRLGRLACDRVLISVAGHDLFKIRAVDYYETLKESGFRGKVRFVETEGEKRYFHLLNATESSEIFFRTLASFIYDDQGRS